MDIYDYKNLSTIFNLIMKQHKLQQFIFNGTLGCYYETPYEDIQLDVSIISKMKFYIELIFKQRIIDNTSPSSEDASPILMIQIIFNTFMLKW